MIGNCFAQWIGHRGLRPASSWLHYYTTTTTILLTLPEAVDIAQNRPLWRMMSTYGATQSWVACQQRRRRRPVFSTPAGGDPVEISWKCLMLIKLKWLGYPKVKNYDNMLTVFIEYRNAADGRTHRQKDGRTDRLAIPMFRVTSYWKSTKSSAVAERARVIEYFAK